MNKELNYLLNEIKDSSQDYIGTNGCRYQDLLREELDLLVNEIERLNNIINELDKFLKDKIDSWKKANDDLIVKDTIYHERLAVRLIYDYLQELKGDGSNE